MGTTAPKMQKHLLSKNKLAQLEEAENNCINAGVQYNMSYERFTQFKAMIDTPEKRAAIIFILRDAIELVELGFQHSPIIEQLGEPETKESMNYREFKLLQEIIKNLRIKGRDNHIKLSQAMKSFNEAGEVINTLESESKEFIKDYQGAGSFYSKLCQNFGIMPEDLDCKVELAFNEAVANMNNKTDEIAKELNNALGEEDAPEKEVEA